MSCDLSCFLIMFLKDVQISSLVPFLFSEEGRGVREAWGKGKKKEKEKKKKNTRRIPYPSTTQVVVEK